mmetsp:Transcript_21472/g.23969  ORF Transcript_21472/g.23969 Transcript_21472/m.23969 type:complete len:280 (+) Transcript_21472:42-881(+)
MLLNLYPEHRWDVTEFHINRSRKKRVKRQPPPTSLLQHHRSILETSRSELGIETLDDFYSVTPQDVLGNRTRMILSNYGNSYSTFLMAVYPEHDWDVEKFSTVPNGYWFNEDNQRSRINSVSEKMRFHALDNWHDCSPKKLFEHGKLQWITQQYGSLYQTLKTLYPKFSWHENSFKLRPKTKTTPRGYWEIGENIIGFVRYAEEKLSIPNIEAWYRIATYQLVQLGAVSLIPNYPRILEVAYPDFKWNWESFEDNGLQKKSSQRQLLQSSKHMFDKTIT